MTTQDRRDVERARRKAAILAAARSVFAESGFSRATVDQIAQRAEVAKGTIYLYFTSKEAILSELVLQALDELAGQLATTGDGRSVLHPEARLRAMAEAYFNFAQRSPDYFRLLTAFDGGSLGSEVGPDGHAQILAASERTLAPVAQAVADGMALGVFRPGEPLQAAAVLWAGLNGSLALLAHPIRRMMVPTDAPGLYHATLETLLCGLCRSPVENQKENTE